MPAPKNPEKRKIWIEKISGKNHHLYGKKNPALAEWNRQHSGEKSYWWNKHLSQETKDKISRANSGEKNYFFGKPNPILTEWNKQHSGKNHPMFGNHHPQEIKDKISKANSGEKNPNYGKHLSQETKDKISRANSGEKNYFFGKPNPILTEWNKQHSGKNHPAWEGGISFEPYTLEFSKQIKELIRSRDGYKCQKCGCSEIEEGKKLSIHHIDYQKENCLPENLVTLCNRCNLKVNINRKKWTKYFQNKLQKKQKQKQLCLSML